MSSTICADVPNATEESPLKESIDILLAKVLEEDRREDGKGSGCPACM